MHSGIPSVEYLSYELIKGSVLNFGYIQHLEIWKRF